MSGQIVAPSPLPLYLPDSGNAFMTNTAYEVFKQIYCTWSEVWIRGVPSPAAKIWYSQVGQEQRWITLNGNQARVMRASVGYGFLNLTGTRQEGNEVWATYRMTGEGNQCFSHEQTRRDAHARRQERWITHLAICNRCRLLLTPADQQQLEELIQKFPRETADICSGGDYYVRLVDWRQ